MISQESRWKKKYDQVTKALQQPQQQKQAQEHRSTGGQHGWTWFSDPLPRAILWKMAGLRDNESVRPVAL